MKTSKKTVVKGGKSRKEAILAAAASVFSRKGYGSTRIEDVAREAGLSYGLAYYYYSSKDRLFHIVTQKALDATMACYEAAQKRKGSSYSKLRFLGEQLLSARFSDEGMPHTLVLVQSLTHSGIPRPTRRLVDNKILEAQEIVMKMIRGAQAEGHAVGKDARSLAVMMNALLAGYSLMRIAYPDWPMPDIDTFLSFLA